MSETRLWETIKREYVIDTPYLRIRKEKVRLPNGQILGDYHIQESRGWVAIFCKTLQGEVVLNWEYKHGIGRYVLELPAGGLELSETPVECAQRELLEETGYVAQSFEKIGTFVIDPSYVDGLMHFFYCKNARPEGKKKIDPREKIKNRLVSVPDLIALIRTGKIEVMGHVAAIYTVLDRKGLWEKKF
jgi:8-oxo-dGTP pyrophosphatase MutT (NUDIX family)